MVDYKQLKGIYPGSIDSAISEELENKQTYIKTAGHLTALEEGCIKINITIFNQKEKNLIYMLYF